MHWSYESLTTPQSYWKKNRAPTNPLWLVSLRDKTKPSFKACIHILFNFITCHSFSKTNAKSEQESQTLCYHCLYICDFRTAYKQVNTCTLGHVFYLTGQACLKLEVAILWQSLKYRSFCYCAIFQNTCSCSIFQVRIFTQLLFFGLSMATANSCSYTV